MLTPLFGVVSAVTPIEVVSRTSRDIACALVSAVAAVAAVGTNHQEVRRYSQPMAQQQRLLHERVLDLR